MPKPSDFFINVIDFFAVLLPGSILVGVAWQDISPLVVERLTPFGTGAQAATFAVLSYVVGQLAYAGGSLLDETYDRWRKRRSATDVFQERARLLATRDGLSPDEQKSVSLYKWAEAQVRVHSPSAAAEIDRAQAESKFFRTLTAVLGVSAAAGFLGGDGTQLVVSAALMPISVQRFFKLRLSATEMAYRYYVVLGPRPLEGETRTAQTRSRAGAVVDPT